MLQPQEADFETVELIFTDTMVLLLTYSLKTIHLYHFLLYYVILSSFYLYVNWLTPIGSNKFNLKTYHLSFK